MAFPYQDVAKAIATRANQLGDAVTAADLNTAISSTLSQTSMSGTEVTYYMLKFDILASEARIVQFIANHDDNAVYRAMFYGRTGDIAQKGLIPTTSIASANEEFTGNFHTCRDSLTHAILTEKKSQELDRINRNAGSHVRLGYHHYQIQGTRLDHTRAGGAYLEGCIYNQIARAAAFDALGNSILPVGCKVWLIADVLVNLPIENWFVQEAGHYGSIAERCEADIMGGYAPKATMADLTSTPEPVTN